MSARGVLLRVMVVNIETAHPGTERGRAILRALALLIDQHNPEVVIVLQAYKARSWLNGVPGYQSWQYRGREASGIAVLVGSSIKLLRRRALRMTRSWRGPDSKGGRLHRPRTYPQLRLEKAGRVVRLLAVHLPTHNNGAAQAESLAAVERWFERSGEVFSIAAGDWNRRAEELYSLDLPVLTVGKVDHAVTTDASAWLMAVPRRLPTPDGCHGWGMYVFDLEAS